MTLNRRGETIERTLTEMSASWMCNNDKFFDMKTWLIYMAYADSQTNAYVSSSKAMGRNVSIPVWNVYFYSVYAAVILNVIW